MSVTGLETPIYLYHGELVFNVQVTLYDVTACREVGNWFSITEYIV